MIEGTLREHSIVMNKSRKRHFIPLSAFLFFIHYSYDIIPEPAFFIRFFFTTFCLVNSSLSFSSR